MTLLKYIGRTGKGIFAGVKYFTSAVHGVTRARNRLAFYQHTRASGAYPSFPFFPAIDGVADSRDRLAVHKYRCASFDDYSLAGDAVTDSCHAAAPRLQVDSNGYIATLHTTHIPIRFQGKLID